MDLALLAYFALTATSIVFCCAICKFCQIRQEIHEQHQQQMEIIYVPLPSAPAFDENPTIQ
jgi:hypothetical protein